MRLADVGAALDALYDPRTAQDWDAVGLVCGDPDAEVRRVLLAVDPVAAVVDEALGVAADLLVTHHPLLLRAVHGVPATTPKGRLVHRLVRGGCALLVAHTNADAADPGVSDALAAALGLRVTGPLDPAPGTQRDVLVTYVPVAAASRVLDALAAAGAGRVGAYERSAFAGAGVGTFRPLAGAEPATGTVGEVTEVAETRLECEVPHAARARAVAAVHAAHPYEQPVVHVHEAAAPAAATTGIGRVAELPEPEPLDAFVRRVAAALPATAQGVRASGDPHRPVRRVAVCGGAGDSLLDAARSAGVDAYVTADLRHHPASEAMEAGGPALVDVAHWASEWPWLRAAAHRLAAALAAASGGTTVDVRVSTVRTDPWTSHSPSPAAAPDRTDPRSTP